MTDPLRSSKLVLVEERRQSPPGETVGTVRRYKLARLRLDGRSGEHSRRFEHLARVYD
jgi:hypothetical protein